MRKAVKKTAYKPNIRRWRRLMSPCSFEKSSLCIRVKKLGRRLVKRKKCAGIDTVLDTIFCNVRSCSNAPISLSMTYTYADVRLLELSSVKLVEKMLVFLMMQIANFVQKDTCITVHIRYEIQFTNIRIENCHLQRNILRINQLLRVIPVIQRWIKSQNGYSDYIIDKNRICNFNIYLLKM